jgi:hypothetical protein
MDEFFVYRVVAGCLVFCLGTTLSLVSLSMSYKSKTSDGATGYGFFSLAVFIATIACFTHVLFGKL